MIRPSTDSCFEYRRHPREKSALGIGGESLEGLFVLPNWTLLLRPTIAPSARTIFSQGQAPRMVATVMGMI